MLDIYFCCGVCVAPASVFAQRWNRNGWITMMANPSRRRRSHLDKALVRMQIAMRRRLNTSVLSIWSSMRLSIHERRAKKATTTRICCMQMWKHCNLMNSISHQRHISWTIFCRFATVYRRLTFSDRCRYVGVGVGIPFDGRDKEVENERKTEIERDFSSSLSSAEFVQNNSR